MNQADDEPPPASGGGCPALAPELLRKPSLWLSDRPTSVTVRGISMEPFLKDADVIEVVKTSRDRVAEGQLLVFERAGELVVHRLLRVRGERILEKGDAQSLGNWLSWPDALGVVSAVTRGEERVQLDEPPWPEALSRTAARHLRRHRVHRAALRLPGTSLRRAFLWLARRGRFLE